MGTDRSVGGETKAAGALAAPRFPSTAPVHARQRAAAFSGDPLMRAAAPLLVRAAGVASGQSGDRRGDLVQALRRFADDARAAGLSPAVVKAARQALEALVEVLSGTAGRASVARFYMVLDALRRDPAANRSLLELHHACLALGFDGLDRDRQDAGDPDCVRSDLYRLLRRPSAGTLSPPPPPPLGARRLRFAPSVWWWLPVLAVALAAVWWMLDGAVSARTDSVTQRMERPVSESLSVVHRGPPPDDVGPALIARVASALAPEVAARTLTVGVAADGALTIRVAGAGMFPIDGDTLSARHRAVFERIGAVLANERGAIAVAGHLDELFAPSDRFPTPEALTLARAEAARRVMEPRLPGRRLSAEGRGRGEPVNGGDPADRARNRRIEVRLYPL
jgi:type VI secretion system protein ImpK